MAGIKLGVIDQSPVRAGGTMAQAVDETLRLARACEGFGYTRYWLAEHHNTSGFAGSCPEILLARLGAETRTMRIGSGGVMLSHYAPLKVAEQFRMLETLYPGRVDLGIGRAPGSDGRTATALQAGPQAWPIEVFPQQVELVRAFLEDARGDEVFGVKHPYRGIHATPTGPGAPEMWLLGSSGESALYAAEMGLPYAFAHFIGGAENLSLIALYRSRFKPRREGDVPRVSIGVSVLCAATDEEAQRLSWSRKLWVLRLLNGRGGPFPSIDEAMAYPFTDTDRAQLKGIEGRSFAGTPERVAGRLRELCSVHGIDEVLALTITHDFGPRVESYRLLAEAMGVGAVQAAAE
jgi:luciferase family oxidoreductase group 1